jgi:hypothetical protein
MPGSVIAAGDAGQPAPLLLLGAVAQEVGQCDVVVQRDAEPGGGGAGPGGLLADHHVEPEVVHPAAAELLRDRHPQEAGLARGGEQLAPDDAGGLPVGQVRHHLAVEEGPHGLAECLVVRLEEVSPHGAAPSTR